MTTPISREEAARLAQVESRTRLDDFVDAMKPLRDMARGVRSKLFGRPDDELKEWLRRGNAIAEIQDSEGYRLIMDTVANEIEWARTKLETSDEDTITTRAYLKALRFVSAFIVTTLRDADISSKVLAGRVGEIPRTQFVKNVAPVRN